MNIGEFVITEAGFGADLGAEKFFNIKCRTARLKPSYVVIVSTIKSIKFNGGMNKDELAIENLEYLNKGIVNLQKHIENIRGFGFEPIIALNKFHTDTESEISELKNQIDAQLFITDVYQKGGEGAIELAEYISSLNAVPKEPIYTYDLEDKIENKIKLIATKIYGARNICFSSKAKLQLKKLEKLTYSKFPICMAKTPYSFSDDPKKVGRPIDFEIKIDDIYVSAGAEMIVVITGDIMTMPGLPKVPNAEKIYINKNGEIEGLS